MDLKQRCLDFIHSPYPLWETALTKVLVAHKWPRPEEEYSTTRIWTGQKATFDNLSEVININNHRVMLESPDPLLTTLYNEHGLDLSINPVEAKNKLIKAFKLLSQIPECASCVATLVKSIQVLHQPEPEYDISYSHPLIPFSIFVSVDQEDSNIATLRLAESILHEAMHLKLTLIEEQIPLIEENTLATFYSPWRDEQRPVRGVLHGLFVFKAIDIFYKNIIPNFSEQSLREFALWRLEELNIEFDKLNRLPSSNGFTANGATLTTNLLP